MIFSYSFVPTCRHDDSHESGNPSRFGGTASLPTAGRRRNDNKVCLVFLIPAVYYGNSIEYMIKLHGYNNKS